MEIRIPIHSFIDLITNSSTEVYISATHKSVEMAKDILQSVLKASGSTSTVDEVFEVFVRTAWRYGTIEDYIKERGYVEDEQGNDLAEGDEGYEEGFKRAVEKLNAQNIFDYESGLFQELVIRMKGSDENLADKMQSLWDYEGISNY